MAISKRKLKANQANAKKSTGPTTPEGKQIVSQNRASHGLCGRFRVLATESQNEYDALLLSFMESEQPANDVERELVAKMVRHTWLSQRATSFQEACFVPQPRTPDQIERKAQSLSVMPDIELYLRYQKHNDRAYQQAAAELARRRKDRDLAARGFESKKRAEAQEQRDMHEEQRREINQIHRQEKHAFHTAAAKMRFEREMQQAVNAKPVPHRPKTLKTAA